MGLSPESLKKADLKSILARMPNRIPYTRRPYVTVPPHMFHKRYKSAPLCQKYIVTMICRYIYLLTRYIYLLL